MQPLTLIPALVILTSTPQLGRALAVPQIAQLALIVAPAYHATLQHTLNSFTNPVFVREVDIGMELLARVLLIVHIRMRLKMQYLHSWR